MKLTMPRVNLEGDCLGLMSTHGELLGLSLSRQLAVWRFGFRPGAGDATVFHVSTEHPLVVLTSLRGAVIETYRGGWDGRLPLKFVHVLDAKL